jgi:hypothetical protein
MANSIKDLVTSVDWKKMLSSPDTRNALIGSALGAAMLGGAGLMQKRDPEESKLAPVGDALTGALLGGVAGYGIPKSLALFRDPGGLAPDGDTLKTNYLGWGLGGAAAGAGVFGGSLYKTLGRAKAIRLEAANRDYDNEVARALTEMADAERNNASYGVRERTRKQFAMLMKDRAGKRDAEQILARYRGRILRALTRRDRQTARDNWDALRQLVNYRNERLRGYRGFQDLLEYAAEEQGGKAVGAFGWLRDKLLRTGTTGPGFTHGAHYAAKAPWWTFGAKVLGPRDRALVRGGKYAIGGALLAMLAHKLTGAGSANNYKN